MPRFLEKKLKREYADKGKSGKSLDRAVYGTLNSQGFMHGSEITEKGRDAEKKHERKFSERRASRDT